MSGETPAEIVAELRTDWVEACCEVAVAALILHEHVITLRQEVRFIWKRKLRSTEALFLLNRFLLLVLGVFELLSMFPLDLRTRVSCVSMQVIFFVLELLCFAVWAVFSALRVYALDNHKWRIAALTLVLGLVPVGTNTFNDSDTAIVYSYDSVFGQLCFDSPKFTSKTYTILVSTTRTCMILSDIIVVAVTWVHTYKIKRAAKAANLQSSLADLLLRDGTFYFVILALLNAAHMSLAITGVFTFLTVFTIPISSIIISRFLLNLRQVDVSRRSADTSLPSFVRPVPSASAVLPAGPDFVTFLTGSMGESLDHSPHDEPMDDDSEDLDEDLETHVHRAAGAAPPVSSQGFTGVSAIF